MILAAIGSHDPGRMALQDENRNLRYGEIAAAVAKRRTALHDASVKVLGLALDNGVDWLLWDLAALSAGIVCVPLPPFFTRSQAYHAITTAAVSHIVSAEGLDPVDPKKTAKMQPREMQSRLSDDSGCRNSLEGGENFSNGNNGNGIREDNGEGGSHARRADSYHAGPYQNDAGAGTGKAVLKGTAKITFTSGTTGTAKGVCLPERAMADVAASIVQVLGEEFVGIHLSVLPLSVLLENVAGVYAGLLAGCTIRLLPLERFGASYEFLHDALKQARASSVIVVPEILRALMAQTAKLGPLPDLRFVAVGGAKLDPRLILQARALGLPVYEGYGLSECASVVSLNTPENDCAGTVGKPLSHVSLRFADGSIHVSNPGFLGYVGEPLDGDFDTGDLGALDDNGFVTLTGRRKNVLITSYGRNVSPEWVEAALLAQPQIAQAVVYGDGRAQLSALIVPADQQADRQNTLAQTTLARNTLAMAVEQANMTLPDYAQIHDFQSIPPLTADDGLLTGTGRPRRTEVFKRYLKFQEQGKAYDIL